MKKNLLISIIFIALVSIALIFVLSNKKADAPQDNSTPAKTSEKIETPSVQLNSSQYIDYSEETLANAEGQRVLFFHASWCPQCRSIENDILENKDSIPTGITIIKVDYDKEQDLRQKYGITLQTTFVKIDDSDNLTDKYVAYDEPTFEAVKRNFL